MIRVLLIDDHDIVRAGIQRLIESDGRMRVVGEATDAQSGYAQFVSLAPDVAIIDLSLPQASGLALIERIRAREPGARLVVLSMHEEPYFVQRALAAGALGYVSKASAVTSLLPAIVAASEGRSFMSPALEMPSQGAVQADPWAALTARELEVLRLLASGRSYSEVSDALALSPKTVANYQTSIKQKLGVTTLSALTRLAVAHGLVSVQSAARD